MLILTKNDEEGDPIPCKYIQDNLQYIENKYNICYTGKKGANSRIEISLRYEKCFGKDFSNIKKEFDALLSQNNKKIKTKIIKLSQKNCQKIKNKLCKIFYSRLINNFTIKTEIEKIIKKYVNDISDLTKININILHNEIKYILSPFNICLDKAVEYVKQFKLKYTKIYLKQLLAPDKASNITTIKKYLEADRPVVTQKITNNLDNDLRINNNILLNNNHINAYSIHNKKISNNKKYKINNSYKHKKKKSNVIPWGSDDDFEDHLSEFIEDTDPEDLPDESDFHEHYINPITNKFEYKNRDFGVIDHPYKYNKYENYKSIPISMGYKPNNPILGHSFTFSKNPLNNVENMIGATFNNKYSAYN